MQKGKTLFSSKACFTTRVGSQQLHKLLHFVTVQQYISIIMGSVHGT